MHKATKELLARRGEIGTLQLRLWTDVITRYGSIEDAIALADLVMEAPKSIDNLNLLGPVMVHGDIGIAKMLFEKCISGKKYADDYAGAIAHCVGFLGLQEAMPMLWQVVKNAKNDAVREPCLALLHLDCSEIADEIAAEIDKYFGQWVFPESLPALAHLTGNKKYAEALFNWGEGLSPATQPACSTCNGGLILGIALYGEYGLPYFRRLLWSKTLDLADSGTGSIFYAYISMRLLGLTFKDLFAEVKMLSLLQGDPKADKYRHMLLLDLLEEHIREERRPVLKFLPPLKETWLDLLEWMDSSEGHEVSFFVSVIKFYDARHMTMKMRQIASKIELKAGQEVERRLTVLGAG